MFINHGNAKSKTFKVSVGAPQGSVLAALLFRLHILFLPSYFPQIICHLFAHGLTIVFKRALEKRLSDYLINIQNQAKIVLNLLEKYADDHILPVNIKKTKVMLVHSAVAVNKPEIYYKNIKIEYVKTFKLLGVEIGTKIGLDDRQWVESQKRSFRTFVFQSTRYLSSSTGNPSNGLIFENDNEQSIQSQSSSTKQLVLIEVSQYIY
ncbi:unnamed protein product [Rotaria sp. Silwood2]|nr:unnamed protein product [Rotaria sp. Silwood2]